MGDIETMRSRFGCLRDFTDAKASIKMYQCIYACLRLDIIVFLGVLALKREQKKGVRAPATERKQLAVQFRSVTCGDRRRRLQTRYKQRQQHLVLYHHLYRSPLRSFHPTRKQRLSSLYRMGAHRASQNAFQNRCRSPHRATDSRPMTS